MTVRVINRPSQDDGGPAFPLMFQWLATSDCRSPFSGEPLKSGDTEHVINEGMTMRDAFAMMASEFDVKSALEDLGNSGGLNHCRSAADRVAAARYHCADAMLAARRSA